MDDIISRFPRFELSYESMRHSKVQVRSDQLYMAIPYGKKYFIWFTYLEDQNVCLLLEIQRYKNEYTIKGVYPVSSSFHSYLSLGTVLYGTLILQEGIKIFVTENVYYYKGKNVSQYVMSKKMTIFSLFFNNDIEQCIYHKYQLLFAMPVHDMNYSNYLKQIAKAYYRIYATQVRSLSKYSTFHNHTTIEQAFKEEKILLVKPCVQNDIYELFCNDKDKLYLVGTACVNTYKTSVLLNCLFRDIKENENLDTLELSDSEEEFENIEEDKFVHLEREYAMKCIYRAKFKAWEPIAKMDNMNSVCSLSDL